MQKTANFYAIVTNKLVYMAFSTKPLHKMIEDYLAKVSRGLDSENLSKHK